MLMVRDKYNPGSIEHSAELLSEAAARIERGEPFAMVTVIRASGSTPRTEGSRMLVNQAGDVVGSVGGGRIERLAIEKALQTFATGRIEHLEQDLNHPGDQESGMSCGGSVELLIEPFGMGPRLYLFGAGHVAQPTTQLAGRVGYHVTVHDSRQKWANRERFPGAIVRVGDMEELAEQLDTTGRDFLLVMSHSHAEDYRVVKRLLRKSFFYLGMIGSPRKAAEIRSKLMGDGFSEEEIARLTCPIGMDIGSHTPMEIAVSVTAQLISLRRNWEKSERL